MVESFERRLTQYRTLEAKMKQMTDAFKAQIGPYAELHLRMRALLLDMLNKSGQNSAKTTAGTVYKTTKQSASVEDPETFMRHVIGTENWDLLDRKANITACLDFAAMNNQQLPPGVKISTKLDIGVRAPPKLRAKGSTHPEPDAEEYEDARNAHADLLDAQA